MEANELMIFDLVRRKEDKRTMIVVEVGYDENIGAITADDRFYGDFEDYHETQVEPIPITPEILEKNGFVEEEYPIIYDRREFELRHGNYRIIVSPLNDGYTRIYKGGYLPILNNCYINFVHELQHALRLCGIEKEIVI